MYELKKIRKVFTSKFVGAGPSSYEKRIYLAAVSQRLRNTGVEDLTFKERNAFLCTRAYRAVNTFHFGTKPVC